MRNLFTLLVLLIMSGCLASAQRVDKVNKRVDRLGHSVAAFTEKAAGIHPELVPEAMVVNMRANDLSEEVKKGTSIANDIPFEATGGYL